MEITRQKTEVRTKKSRPRKLKVPEDRRWELMQAYWHTELIGRRQVEQLCHDYGVGPGYARALALLRFPETPRSKKRKISVEVEHQLIQAYLHKDLLGSKAVQELCVEFGASRGYAAARALELYGVRMKGRGYKTRPAPKKSRVNHSDPRWERARAALRAGLSPDEWETERRDRLGELKWTP